MSKSPSTPRLRIPVRHVDGIWELAFGGAVPVMDSANAELLIESRFISDDKFIEALRTKGRHKVLDEGAKLLVSLTVKPDYPPPENLGVYLKPYDKLRGQIATEHLDAWKHPTTLSFVEVIIDKPDERQAQRFKTDNGGLWLLTQGLEAKGLESTRVHLPEEISRESVASLNHAYTKLSEAFETWRISHTGNIYSRVLYQERNGRWYPLDVLRNRALDHQEQEIARELWERFMAQMTRHSEARRQ